MTNTIRLKVSLNKRGRNKANPQLLATGWKNSFYTPKELAEWIGQGYAWAGTHFQSGKRSASNARGSNCIVFDFDGELQLQHFWTSPTARAWCAFTYTSASSTDAVNRFRAVFPLAGAPLATAWEHRTFYQFIALKLASELSFEIQDDCGQKPERLWYGHSEATIIMNDGAHVPADVVASVEIPDEPNFSCGTADGITDLDVKRCQWLLQYFIEPSQDGEYNEIYVPVTAACAAIGDPMIDVWIDWVSRGHHGDKPANLNPNHKWAGLGSRSGPSKLYSLAKAQDPSWSRKLPPELRYGNGGGMTDPFPSLDTVLMQSMHHVPKNIFSTT